MLLCTSLEIVPFKIGNSSPGIMQNFIHVKIKISQASVEGLNFDSRKKESCFKNLMILDMHTIHCSFGNIRNIL